MSILSSHNTRHRLQKPFLITVSLILISISITYGFIPESTLKYLYDIEAQVYDPTITHILRALMGLYLGMAAFCLIGAFSSLGFACQLCIA